MSEQPTGYLASTTPLSERTLELSEWWLNVLTPPMESESRCIGTQSDENGVEREVWQHTMTPHPLDELIRAETTDAGNTLTAADLNALIERMFDHEVYEPYPAIEMTDASVFCMTRSMAHRIRVLTAKAQRSVRARKRARRQRRAAQRRHNRGRV